MVWTLNFWVGSVFFVLLGCASVAQAQPSVSADEKPLEFQTEPDHFTEQVKALNAATDKDSRRKAIDAVLARATELKVDPAPLVAVLKNRQPEVLYNELLAYLKEGAEVRHLAFLPHLISAAHDAGEAAKTSRDIVLGYDAEGVIAALQTMLKAEDQNSALAAAAFAAEKIGGLKGRARLVPGLIGALASSNNDLKATAGRSLRELTLLEFPDDARQWSDWLGQKSEDSLIEEIGNRLEAALRKSEQNRKELEAKLVKVTLEQMQVQKENQAALIKHLRESEFLQVRLEAARLLGDLLAKQADEAAKPAIDALGTVLLDLSQEEPLRIACTRALAVKPAPGFAYIDKAFELNGLSPNLKLELVRALKGHVAAPRLADLLKREIDGIDTASSTILGELIVQAQSVIEPATPSESRAAVLGELARTLKIIATRFSGELPIGERDRFALIAQQVSSSLVHIARVRATDISACVDALLDAAGAINLRAPAAASGALTAIREALKVEGAREGLIARLSSEPLASKVHKLYDLAAADDNAQSLLIVVLSIYETMAWAPQDVLDSRLKDLLAKAEAAPDPLAPESANTTLRAAQRLLLARATKGLEAQAALVTALLDKPFGDNDALDVLRQMPSPRGEVIVKALQPRIDAEPERIALLMRALEPSLSAQTKENAAFKAFSEASGKAVKATFAKRIDAALVGPLDDKAKEVLRQNAQSLFGFFLSTAYERLNANAAESEGRDFIAKLVLDQLKAAHPGRYDNVALTGDAQSFKKALADLKPRLTEDNYSVG